MTAHTAGSAAPVLVSLYSASQRVAATQTDLLGRYTLVSPPGDYWLELSIDGRPTQVERVWMRPGSFRKDFDLAGSPEPPTAVAEVCGEVQGTNGRGIPATVLAYAGDRCVAGAHTDARGRYCLTAPPGSYWLRARSAGSDVAFERLELAPGSFRRDVRSAVEVVELPPIEVTFRAGREAGNQG